MIVEKDDATNLTKLWVFDRKQCIQILGREFIADMRTPFLCLKVFVLYKYVCNIAYMYNNATRS